MAAIEVEETIRRIASHKGVEGIVVCNFEGVSLKSTLSKELSTQYAGLMAQLVTKGRSVVRTIDSDDDLVFLRVRTKKHEVMVAPGDGYMLIVRAGFVFVVAGAPRSSPPARAPRSHAPRFAPLCPRLSKSFEFFFSAPPVAALLSCSSTRANNTTRCFTRSARRRVLMPGAGAVLERVIARAGARARPRAGGAPTSGR
jgi:dynein light chain roadblock-type